MNASESTDKDQSDTAEDISDGTEPQIPSHCGFTIHPNRPPIGGDMRRDDAVRYNIDEKATRISYNALCEVLGLKLPPLLNYPGETCECLVTLQLLSSTTYTYKGEPGKTLRWLVWKRLNGRTQGPQLQPEHRQALEHILVALDSQAPMPCVELRASLNAAKGINVPAFKMPLPQLMEAFLDLVFPREEQAQFTSKVQRAIACQSGPPLNCNEHTSRPGEASVKVFQRIDPQSQYNEPYSDVIAKYWTHIGGRPWQGPAHLPRGTCRQGHPLSDPAAMLKEKIIEPAEKVIFFFDEFIQFDFEAATRKKDPDPEERRKAQRYSEIRRRISVTPHEWLLLGVERRNASDRNYGTADVRGAIFDVKKAAWYQLRSYALQNVPGPRDPVTGRPTPAEDPGFDHVVLRTWHAPTGRCFQVDSVGDHPLPSEVECYEIGRGDFFRAAKVVFALYEKTSRSIKQGTVAAQLTVAHEAQWPDKLQHKAGLPKTVAASKGFKASDYEQDEEDPNQPGPSTRRN